MTEELKACPFCGGTDLTEYGNNRIGCNNDACGSGFNIMKEYKGRPCWNARPIEDALQAELKASQDRVEELTDAVTGSHARGFRDGVMAEKKRIRGE